MKQVIRINEEPKEEKELKPIEITHILDGEDGWSDDVAAVLMKSDEIVTYLGCCREDGDMFMTKDDKGDIRIYKGHLNDGVY